MSYDSEIHDALKEMDQSVCDFYGIKLVDNIIVRQEDPCCEEMDLVKNNSLNVWQNCSVVDCYDLQAPYIDFNENRFKFKRKSVYIRNIIF